MVRVSRNGDKLAIYDVTPYNLRRIDEHNKSLNGSINGSIIYFQDRSAILASPPSPSERSGEGEGGDA